MTTPTRRSLAAASAALLLLLTAGCGVESGDDSASDVAETTAPADTTTTEADAPDTTEADVPDTTEADDSSVDDTEADDSSVDDTVTDDTTGGFDGSDLPEETRQQIIKIYTDMGLTQDQATCLLDGLTQQGNTGMNPNDISAMMDFLGQCDISITDFRGGGFGG